MRHMPIGVLLGFAVVSAVQAHGGREMEADLRGRNEVPAVETESRGHFELQQSRDGSSAEFTLRISDGTRITQAHLHCGQAGVNGPVIVFLAGLHAAGWDVDGRWISNTTLTDANVVNPACGATLAEVMEQARAGNVYVNVHSVQNPAGVIRGQLLVSHRRHK